MNFSGKKNRHTIKSQVVVNKGNREIICTAFCAGSQHDFKLFVESKTRINPSITVITDSGYQGIKKLHKNSLHPVKASKNKPLSQSDKDFNRSLSSERALNENVIGFIKRFKIISERYRNRRKRFGLRFNLIAGICKQLIAYY